ncbi:MAG: NfeD family protein [Nitrososphaerota archaeon]|nr:NfeD family protein [Nitrososphaerota archaeon]MDG6922829.1 NfeD family protein [Nitrososphaerota archaeon]
MEKQGRTENAPLLCRARFGLGPIVVMSVLVIMMIALYRMGFKYLAILPAAVGILIFTVKSMEKIQLQEPEQRKIVGKKCLVVRETRKNQSGVVRLYTETGSLDNEMWSAESAHGDTIEEGRYAKVVGLRGIFLIIENE